MDPSVLVVTGSPGVGKSTVSALLATRVARAAHVNADVLHRMITSGAEWPSAATAESGRQLLLRTRNAAQLAANFAAARIWPIIDEVIATVEQLSVIDELLESQSVGFVVLSAPRETLLARDAGRTKQTAANYLELAPVIEAVLGPRARVVDTTQLSPEATARSIQELWPKAGWLV